MACIQITPQLLDINVGAQAVNQEASSFHLD
jgi:hypothetical protein